MTAVQAERDHHREAFEHYRDQGPTRTLKATAAAMGASTTSVQRWAKSFDWKRRARQHDVDTARQAAADAEKATRGAQAPGTAEGRDSPHHALVKGATVAFARALAKGDVPVRLGDLERLIKLDRWLRGEDDDTDGTPDATAEARAELERMDDAELFAAFRAEVDKLNALIATDERMQELEADGEIAPLTVADPRRLVPDPRLET